MQKQITKYSHIKGGLFRGVIVLVMALWLASGLQRNSQAAENLYVAGIPDEYPIEYYDKNSGSYEGVLPELLHTAAKQIGLTVKYIEASNKDNRLALAKNLQVDVMCALGFTDEELEEAGLSRGETIVSYMEGEQEIKLSFAYTESMSQTSRDLLEQKLQKIDHNSLLGLQVKYAKAGHEQNNKFLIFHRVIPTIMVVMFIILLVMPFHLKKRKKQIEEITFMDEETGQYNFARWKQKYMQSVKAENSQHYAILYLYAGIENISHIYGYIEASEAVQIIGNVCQTLVDEETEGVARFNEFYFIFFIRYGSNESLKERIQRIHKSIRTEFETRKKKYFLEFNTGIYKLTSAEIDLQKVLQYSKVALEYAKVHYLTIATYNEYVERETISGYVMEHEAIHGLMQEEFVMYLQPMQDAISGELCGAETLVRWQNPMRGLLKPGEFLDVMKRKNLTGKMNMEIYRQGCRFLKSVGEKGHYPCLLFNFSAENFGDDRFADELLAITQQYDVDTKQIIIQLNQMVEISESELFVDTIRTLREYKFDVCLAGLELDKVFFEYLKCGVNYIKLRRELVQNSENPKGKKVLQSVVQLCHDLELKTICVGVEKEEQAKILQHLGCELATGFYYYYPVNQEIFTELLNKN